MDVTSRPRNRLDAAREAIAAHLDEFIALRHDIHQYPELAFHEHRTSRLVASKLASWGYDVTTGIARTGVVATLPRGRSAPSRDPGRYGCSADRRGDGA